MNFSYFYTDIICVIIFEQGLSTIVITYIHSDLVNRLYNCLDDVYRVDRAMVKKSKLFILCFKILFGSYVTGVMLVFFYAISQHYCGNLAELCGFITPIVSI